MGHALNKRGLTVSPLAALLMSCALAPAVAYSQAPTSITFGTPVRLPTFQSCGGYEPGIALDKVGNSFVTAHKQNHCDAVALDPNPPPGVRAQLRFGTSADGANLLDIPGTTALSANPRIL